MRTPRTYAALLALTATLPVLVFAGELSSEEKEALKQIRDVARRYVEHCVKNDKSLPSSFNEFISADEIKTLTVSKLAQDASKPSYQLLTPARKPQNIVNPAVTPVIRSTFKTRDGHRFVAFADGHVEILAD